MQSPPEVLARRELYDQTMRRLLEGAMRRMLAQEKSNAAGANGGAAAEEVRDAGARSSTS